MTHRTSTLIAIALATSHLLMAAPVGRVAEPRIAERTPGRQSSTIRANRTVPAVTPAPLVPRFSTLPTDDELFRSRIFEEPLTPSEAPAVVGENAGLARALQAYLEAGGRDAVEPLRQFLANFQRTRWRASLLTNMGLVYRRTGQLSRALAAWEEAWTLSSDATAPATKAVADRAIGELFELNASLGRADALEALFAAIDRRDVRGSAAEKVSGARQALWLMQHRPEESFRCGPLALDQILRLGTREHVIPAAIEQFKSTRRGTSLLQVKEVAEAVGRPMRLARREPGAHVYVPSVLHWKVGHFAAIVAMNGDEYLVRDPTFGGEMWVRHSTLDGEASGAFLVPQDARPLLPGWRPMDDTTASTVWGRGISAGIDNKDNDDEPECGGCGGSGPGGGPGFGMPVASIHLLQVAVRLKDVPVGYDPPVGPSARFRVTYNQRDASQPQTFSYANLGPKWTFDWLSFVEDDPGNPVAAVTVYHRNGGSETSTSFNPATQSYAPTIRKQAVVVRTSSDPIVYERQLPDGSVEVFAQPNGALSFPRKVFLTAIKDAAGNALTFTWDGQLRMVAATDAVGQVTTISYEHADPLKITKVTDPYGRVATFQYDASGRLESITDVLGLQSSFTYGFGDAIKTLTTPYGETRMTVGEAGLLRWAEITDPLGGRERVQYGVGLVFSEPASEVPDGMPTATTYINHHNTLHWDKRAMAVAPGDPAAATDYHWALVQSGAYLAAAVPLNVKRPLENRIWYAYHGGWSQREGTIRKPVAVGRVLDDGSSQVTRYEYNARGKMTKRIDPLGRETVYEYDASTGLDLVRVKQKNGASFDVLNERTYNSQGLPLTVTDAAGETTTYTYDAHGQVQTVTNPKNETTTNTYTNSRLTSVTGPVSGATTTLAYDSHGRLRTTTDADGYAVTTDYDEFDRPTRTTYPDGTYEETSYRYLDPLTRRDRLGRVTRYTYDDTRRLTATRDPLGRVVTQEWCTCGSLEALVDANGNRTAWERDVQGRVTREVRANGAATQYVYETRSSRLKTVTDAKAQVATYTYTLDDQLTSTSYTNAAIATPSVNFTYDAIYGRVASMVDGTGTTIYGYHTVGTPGATQLASVDGPLTDDTITYTYDQLGRVTTRAINGVGVTWAFDALGRVTTEANVLGTFTYAYDGPTSRLANVSYPNGQTSAYGYYGNTGDRRLLTIHHRYPSADTLSKFDYTYDAAGNILSWRQQADTTAVQWAYGYDLADQLTVAVKSSTDGAPGILQRYSYSYDPAGNRTGEQIGDALTGASYNNVNQLVSQQPSGGLRFEGSVSEPATVTVGGTSAVVTPDNQFVASSPIVGGTNTVSITATDGSGNTSAHSYQVDGTGSAKTFTYDANGNLTADGTRTFEWDARNQLVAVNVGTHRSEFTYDGQQRRVRVIEKENSVTELDTKVVWCGKEECEERAADGATVTRRMWGHAEQAAGGARFFATDHVGSVTDVTDGAATGLARYTFDAWGRRTVATGTDLTSVGYTGHRWQEAGRVWVALYRAYDPDLGRWLSEDPVGLGDGPNLLAYAGNDPVGSYDPFGLTAYRCRRPLGGRGGISRTQRATNTYHEYYCVSNGGVTRCCGQTTDSRRGYGPGRPTRPDEGDVLDPEQCTSFPATDCVEKCLLRNCDSPRPWYGLAGPGTNCQEWTADSRNACAQACEPPDPKGGK